MNSCCILLPLDATCQLCPTPGLLHMHHLAVGASQIKLSYSVHRDLNVKANNERGWDWTGSNLLQTPPAPQPHPHNGGYSGPPTPVNPLACTPEDAPTGRQPALAHAALISGLPSDATASISVFLKK